MYIPPEKRNRPKDIQPMIQLPRERAVELKGRAFREYLQSFVSWMRLQNEAFCENLSMEEITNYFIGGLNHPLWLRIYMKNDPFSSLVRIDIFIRKYTQMAEMLEENQYVEIRPKKEGSYTFRAVAKRPPATPQQKAAIRTLCRSAHIGLEPWDLNNIDMYDALYALAMLKVEKELKAELN